MKKRRHVLRRMLAASLSVMMLGTMIPAASQAAGEATADDRLIASYPLLTDTADVSGKGNDGIAAGTVTFDEQEGMTLPGGGSARDYVEIPGSMFENQENLTISAWIKSNTNAGNYAALFFGTTESLPTGYWLFNPTNPSGLFKSVFTNGWNESKPYSTEAGVTGVSTAAYKGQWVHYTTVLTENSVTGYINGEKIGSAVKTRKVADFGTGLKAYIGRSSYADPDYAGTFQDVKVYAEAKDADAVADIFSGALTDSTRQVVLAKEKAELTIGSTANVIADLTLPAEGKYNTKITWESSDPSVVGNDGKVTLGTEEKEVTLTAVIGLGSSTAKKEFQVRTAKESDVLNIVADGIVLPYIITEDTKLQESIGGADVTWTSGNTEIIGNDGTITAPEEGISDEVTLKAKVVKDGQTVEKTFVVRVIEKDPEYVLGYTCSNVDAALGGSLHLAIGDDENGYEPLLNNTGVYFPKADLSTVAGTTKTLETPYMFRMADGNVGVIAVRNDGKVLCAVTEDMLAYEEKVIDLHTTEQVVNPTCVYNGKEYVITWKTASGAVYQNVTEDFNTIGNPQAGSEPAEETPVLNVSGTVPCNKIPVTKKEAQKLRVSLQKLENTGVVEKDYDFVVQTGKTLDVEDDELTITASYNDGTTDEIPVEWDMSKVDYSKEGTYEITGKAKLTSYPVLNGRADPNIVKYNDKYYFIATGETQSQSQVCIREADTPRGLFDAPDHELIPNVNQPRWAPELHEINGKLYIFLAVGAKWNLVQSSIMELKEGGDPTKKEDWSEPVRVTRADGSNLYDEGITLDMTYFEVNGVHYVCWAQRYINGSNYGTSDLWIATIEPDNPYVITNDPVCIVRNQYGWDRVDTTVDEGPFIIKNDGRIYMTFSGAGTGQLYVVGLLTADEDADLMDAASWKETGYPILTSESVPGENGPGHSCFCIDEDGRPIFVYHLRPNGGTRSASVRRVHFGADGAPVLSMTVDRELKEEYREVKGTVTVSDNPEPKIDVTEKFEDVNVNDWYVKQVQYVFDHKVMTGKDETHFAPTEKLVRAQFAAVLYKMNESPAMEYKEIFPDVTDHQWFTDSVLWAAENKIVTGYTDTNTFQPVKEVTRAEMATMLYRYARDYKKYDVTAEGDYSAFSDAKDVQEFAEDAMSWAVDRGIITGKTVDGQLLLDPQGNADRAECATIIQRFMEFYEK